MSRSQQTDWKLLEKHGKKNIMQGTNAYCEKRLDLATLGEHFTTVNTLKQMLLEDSKSFFDQHGHSFYSHVLCFSSQSYYSYCPLAHLFYTRLLTFYVRLAQAGHFYMNYEL